jgi:DNA-binding LacI/PurR family transcriptional regulator
MAMNRPAKPGERPTMEMVAALAGVSKITVSRALRGSELVRPELRERIAKLASEAGYRMNVAARSLRTRRTQTIAVVIEQLQRDDRPIADPLLLTMIGGLLEVLTPADHAILLTTHDHFLESNAIGADGVVVLGQGEGGRGLQRVGSFGLPVVAWGEPVPGLNVPVIGSDNRQGGRLAAEHLVATGRKRLLFLGDARHPEVAGRLEGVREVLAATEAALAGVIPCAFATEAGARGVREALDAGLRFDAVIAVSDFIAAGACDALATHNIAVPGVVAVVGFDDTPIASTHRPSISSVRQDATAAGRALGEAILAIINGAKEQPHTTPLSVELIVRESSGG